MKATTFVLFYEAVIFHFISIRENEIFWLPYYFGSVLLRFSIVLRDFWSVGFSSLPSSSTCFGFCTYPCNLHCNQATNLLMPKLLLLSRFSYRHVRKRSSLYSGRPFCNRDFRMIALMSTTVLWWSFYYTRLFDPSETNPSSSSQFWSLFEYPTSNLRISFVP